MTKKYVTMPPMLADRYKAKIPKSNELELQWWMDEFSPQPITEFIYDHQTGEAVAKVQGQDLSHKMRIDADSCTRAALEIEGAFSWVFTKEGGQYWRDVVERLKEIAYKGTGDT